MCKRVNSKEYEYLQKELKNRVNRFPLYSAEVVEISQKMDEYIVQAMKDAKKENFK